VETHTHNHPVNHTHNQTHNQSHNHTHFVPVAIPNLSRRTIWATSAT